MKICPQCHQKYSDETLNYCLNDGVKLEAEYGEQETLIYPAPSPSTPPNSFNTIQSASQPTISNNQPMMTSQMTAPKKSRAWLWTLLILGGLIVLCGGGLIGVAWKIGNDVTGQINSIDFNGVAKNFNVAINSSNNENSSQEKNSKVAVNQNKAKVLKSGDSSTLTQSNYNKIKTGMSYDEVVEILGDDGEEVSSSEVGEYKTETFKWSGENYSFIIITFQNDKIIFKTQANLK